MIEGLKRFIFNFLSKTTSYLMFKNYFLGFVFGKLTQVLMKNKYRIVPIADLNNQKNRTIIKPKHLNHVYAPVEIDFKVNRIEKEYNSLGYNIFSNGIVSGATPFVLKDDKILRQKYNTKQAEKEINYRSGLIIQNTGKYAFIKMIYPPVNLEKGIFIGGSWPRNWYHWLIEILSKVELMEYLPKEYKTYPILLPEIIRETESLISITKIIFPSSTFIFLDSSNWYKVNKLVWLDSPVISSPKSKTDKNSFSPLNFNFDWELMSKFKDRIFENINLQQIQTGVNSKRIFLARKQNKRKYNQDEVLTMLKKYDFEAVYLENYKVVEQISIVHKASFIVGPTGAAWANLLFCKENSKGLIWLPEAARGAATYANLSKLSNIDLVHYYFPCKSNNWKEFMHSNEDINIDVNKLESIIIKMLE